MKREELLERLYRLVWHEIATYESDNDSYAYISYDDLDKIEQVCTKIEESDMSNDDPKRACRELLEALEQWVRDNTHHHQALQCYSYSEPYVDAGALMDRLRELRAR